MMVVVFGDFRREAALSCGAIFADRADLPKNFCCAHHHFFSCPRQWHLYIRRKAGEVVARIRGPVKIFISLPDCMTRRMSTVFAQSSNRTC